MDTTILMYIIVGLGASFLLNLITKIFLIHYRQGVERRQKKKEAKRAERDKWRYHKVALDNPLLQRMAQSRFIIFKGAWGNGKSILMNLMAHYLMANTEKMIKKNRRYYKFMMPDKLAERKALSDEKRLPVYSNLDFVQGERKSQDLIPYITSQRRAVQWAVFCIDEVASYFPKEMYYESQGASNPAVEEMKELFKKFRHYTNGWILGTEQDGKDIYIGFRKNGYLTVTALGTITRMSRWAKTLRCVWNALNASLPAILTTNVHRLVECEIFGSSKIKAVLKAFLPKSIGYPIQYYRRKQTISNKIKYKYLRFQTRLQLDDGSEWVFTYSNKDIFQYNTRAYENEYTDKFNADGTRKEDR